MASTDFETEKNSFREFYEGSRLRMDGARRAFEALISSLVDSSSISVSKIESRVKDREECIKKFNRKYRTSLEESGATYSIREKISDLIGVRVVCLYEDDVELIKAAVSPHFDVIEITDKISRIESTESSFGYKGLHLDLKLEDRRSSLPEYANYAEFPFELQLRTIIQDSWSVLDHKIKYKKSIPNRLKRRINTLAALFELADREFKEIRISTDNELKIALEADPDEGESESQASDAGTPTVSVSRESLNAFTFLKIANHFFHGEAFEAHKVDGFTQEITELEPGMTRRNFNMYLKDNISSVKKYKAYFEKQNPQDQLNSFTIIRHCLYAADKVRFQNILTSVARKSYEEWMSKNVSK